jgi:hypothetical protein
MFAYAKALSLIGLPNDKELPAIVVTRQLF